MYSPTQPWNLPDPAECWQWSETAIRSWQLQRLNQQFKLILPHNRFYRNKLACENLQLAHLDDLQGLPFTTKSELVQSASEQTDQLSTHHTFAAINYSRVHRTSGTTGRPLMICDTLTDWNWWSSTWQHVLQAAGVDSSDRVFLAFSFGPFIGFWSAHSACVDRGAMVIPGGGLSSLARLDFISQISATTICCTPSYALHLAEVARNESIDLRRNAVNKIIVAGEAGGSLLAVRQQIETAWGASVIDHSGATEIGPWGFGWPDRPGLHIIETSFIAEFLPMAGPAPQPMDGDWRELVLTSLGRIGAPVIRYRTGDIVRVHSKANADAENCRFAWLPDGVIGRVDNMVTVRGVNVFPSSVEEIVRQLGGIQEYRVYVDRVGELDQLTLEVEASEAIIGELQKLFSIHLGLRIPVRQASAGSLPRSEAKSVRWIDRRQ
ncbi:MAG: hypothetical protein KDB03_07770 [Planctomycetales bacterium]|nr:hypothetical protein [Planctomycetales bacterium]